MKDASNSRKSPSSSKKPFSKKETGKSSGVRKTGLPPQLQKKSTTDKVRLNKYLGNAGMCTRRDADLYISMGNVKVNGKIVTELGFKVAPTDEVRFDGQLVSATQQTYVILNKPKAFTTDLKTTDVRKTVYNLTRTASKQLLKPASKLLRQSSGLIVMSNDEHFLSNLNSSKRIEQMFHVHLNRPLSMVDYEKIMQGVWVKEREVKIDKLTFVEDARKKELSIQTSRHSDGTLIRVFEKLDYKVTYMDRVRFGGITKKDLPRGKWRALTKQEMINLKVML